MVSGRFFLLPSSLHHFLSLIERAMPLWLFPLLSLSGRAMISSRICNETEWQFRFAPFFASVAGIGEIEATLSICVSPLPHR